MEALPSLLVCLPSATFDRRLTLHGSKRSAELITFENAHTGSDTILWLPDDGILFAADLLFVDNHPYLGECDPLAVLKTSKELAAMNAKVYVPGHGPVGSQSDFTSMIEYVEHCMAVAQGLVNDGARAAQVDALEMPEKNKAWQLGQFYRDNIRSLMERSAIP